jgi:hypothetical protein
METITERVRAAVDALADPAWDCVADHEERLRRVAAQLPPAVWHRVRHAVATRYTQLEERYGRREALVIVTVGILATPVPVPGATFLAAAPLIGLAELHRRLTAEPELSAAHTKKQPTLTEAESRHIGEQWVQELANLLKEA